MFKRRSRILYSDVPRPYDAEAARLLRWAGIFAVLALIAACLMVLNG
jgi:hypothetical protein